jgi:hypothetical protein
MYFSPEYHEYQRVLLYYLLKALLCSESKHNVSGFGFFFIIAQLTFSVLFLSGRVFFTGKKLFIHFYLYFIV